MTHEEAARMNTMQNELKPCPFCGGEGKEVKRCERRKDLLACGVIPWGSKECPYQG